MMKKNLFFLGSILLLGFLASYLYWGGLHGPFLLDDSQTIDYAQSSSFNWQTLWQVAMANHTGPTHRPLSVLSFTFNHYFFGPDPFSYKTINLMLHGVTGFILYFALMQLLPFFTTLSNKKKYLLALSTSAIWLVHPLWVSTTLYVVQRMAILSTLFMLLTLLCYFILRRSESKSCLKKTLLWFLIFIFWGLSLASKENAILLPVILFAFEVCVPRESSYYALFYRRLMMAFTGLILIGGSLYYISHWPIFSNQFSEKGLTLGQHLLIESQAVTWYIKALTIPSIHEMGLFHDDFSRVFYIPQWICVPFLLALLASGFLVRRKVPLIAFGLFWFFIGLSLESTLLPLESVFEHRAYFPSMGLFLIINFGLIQFGSRTKTAKKIAIGFFILWFIALSFLTWLRVQGWATRVDFLVHAAIKHPFSARMHVAWAELYISQGQYELAYSRLLEAEKLAPHNAGPTLHALLLRCNLPQDTTATQEAFLQTLKALETKSVSPYVMVKFILLVQSQLGHQCSALSLAQTDALLQAAIQNPFMQTNPYNQSILYYLKGTVETNRQEYANALKSFDKAYALNTHYLDPLLNKVALLLYLDKRKEAEETLAWIEKQPERWYPSTQAELVKLQTILGEQ